jgi:hypothetical protein
MTSIWVNAFLEIRQANVDRSLRHFALRLRHAAGRIADGDERVRHATQLAQTLIDLREHRVGPFERVAFGQRDRDFELALIVLGTKSSLPIRSARAC